MNSKKIYRISLFKGADTMAKDLAVLAALSNGSEDKCTLQDLNGVVNGQKLLYPGLYKDSKCELIGSNILHLDMKIKDTYETILVLEEVEIMDLTMPQVSAQDAKDILAGLSGVPTIDRNLGLLDETNPELLN